MESHHKLKRQAIISKAEGSHISVYRRPPASVDRTAQKFSLLIKISLFLRKISKHLNSWKYWKKLKAKIKSTTYNAIPMTAMTSSPSHIAVFFTCVAYVKDQNCPCVTDSASGILTTLISSVLPLASSFSHLSRSRLSTSVACAFRYG